MNQSVYRLVRWRDPGENRRGAGARDAVRVRFL